MLFVTKEKLQKATEESIEQIKKNIVAAENIEAFMPTTMMRKMFVEKPEQYAALTAHWRGHFVMCNLSGGFCDHCKFRKSFTGGCLANSYFANPKLSTWADMIEPLKTLLSNLEKFSKGIGGENG